MSNVLNSKQTEVNINGTNYLIMLMSGRDGFRVGKKIAKVMGPSIAAFLQGGEEWGMSAAIEALTNSLDDFDDELVNSMLATVYKGNMAINFDEEFAGNYGTLVKLLIEVAKANKFHEVFTEAQGVLGNQ